VEEGLTGTVCSRAEIESELPRGLPVQVRVAEAVLMTEHEDGLWRVADTFPFGGR
jgi:hypothetical protein